MNRKYKIKGDEDEGKSKAIFSQKQIFTKYLLSCRVHGYFTVEAALIYPFVIAVILLVIYLWFFLYDRCLMEQDLAGILVKSVAKQEVAVEERIEYSKEQLASFYREQYLCWSWGEASAGIKDGKLTLKMGGNIEFPFQGLNFWSDSNTWGAEREYKGAIHDQAFIIRTYRKILNFK